MLYKLLIILSLNFLLACSSLAIDNVNYQVLDEVDLGLELKETSGLFCSEQGNAYTVNDSGNKSTIYKINAKGEVLNKQDIDIKNRDWEAITGDDNHFYIGDIGNNNGKRKFVQIHTIEKDSVAKPKKISKVTYLDNSIKKNEYLNHDFDAESLVKMKGKFYLFSKSWRTGILFIYSVSPEVADQKVRAISEVRGLPGIITGGDYDENLERFILAGYELKGLGSFYPFIAILNNDFELIKTFSLEDYEQVEGLCVTPNGDIWITQEGSFFSKQKLIKLKIR